MIWKADPLDSINFVYVWCRHKDTKCMKAQRKRDWGRGSVGQLRQGIKFRCRGPHQGLAQDSGRCRSLPVNWLSELWLAKNRQKKSRYLCEKMCLISCKQGNEIIEQPRFAEMSQHMHVSRDTHFGPYCSQADASSLCHWV